MASSNRIISVLCTLGPSSLNRQVIERLQARDVDLFRINLSHTPLDKVAETINVIQSHSSTPICLDTEGAQVRTGTMENDVVVGDRRARSQARFFCAAGQSRNENNVWSIYHLGS